MDGPLSIGVASADSSDAGWKDGAILNERGTSASPFFIEAKFSYSEERGLISCTPRGRGIDRREDCGLLDWDDRGRFELAQVKLDSAAALKKASAGRHSTRTAADRSLDTYWADAATSDPSNACFLL